MIHTTKKSPKEIKKLNYGKLSILFSSDVEKISYNQVMIIDLIVSQKFKIHPFSQSNPIQTRSSS